MNKRKVKKNLSNGLQSVIDNAHDVAVMHNVLWYIYGILNGRDVHIYENPFRSDELNKALLFIHYKIKEKSCTKK